MLLKSKAEACEERSHVTAKVKSPCHSERPQTTARSPGSRQALPLRLLGRSAGVGRRNLLRWLMDIYTLPVSSILVRRHGRSRGSGTVENSPPFLTAGRVGWRKSLCRG